ncbi:exonuclease tos isoform X2 [Megalopta genalis]|uniref:exonuclease tos isoform X2 n=1 Tax=Megalopta genalis TaxID=115081 RepID=UPI003FD40706
MGITGLLPFLEKSSRRTNINEFSGGTVAIDSYCWLHKGVFTCADKLAMGQPTDAYVHYCMKFIYMLLSHKIKPILVFDGRHLPAKALTEDKRREARQINRSKAIELIKMGQHAEGRNLLRRSIDVTHEMALQLIKQCQKMNVDCIVAPYEADAQLAYLNISGIADVVITEDSDLTLFGCKKVFFKMDVYGHGTLVDQEHLHLAMGLQAEQFSMDSFRYMCILSGCDYLPSLSGIGLTKAKKFIMLNTDCDIYRALTRLGSYLKMKSLVVTKEYRDAFILADITFKHQLVFCPLQRKQVRLNPLSPDITEEQLYYAGVETNQADALQLALGNCDPFSLEVLHNFDPDKEENQNRSNAWGRKSVQLQHTSIWSRNYQLRENFIEKSPHNKCQQKTANKEMILQTNRLRRSILPQHEDNTECTELNRNEILNIYESKDSRIENNLETNLSLSEQETSPILIKRINPFSTQTSTDKTSPSLLSRSRSRIKGRGKIRVRRTIINENVTEESKFFANTSIKRDNNNIIDCDALYASRNSNEIFQEERDRTTEENNATNNINVQSLITTDKMDTESCSMDIDEECNTAFISNQRNVIDDSNSSSNFDLGKSYLDTQTNEFVLSEDNNRSDDVTKSFTSPESFADSDFLISQENINTSTSSLFKWSNTNNKTKLSNSKKSSNSRTSGSKTNTTSSTRRSQQLSSVQRQGLLSMYGFEKRKLL